ncbi:MAG: single-stranded DNA-binding protein [Candidatus Binataceae bacterium]
MGRKVTGNRIELWGKLTSDADLRITPAGTAVLRMAVECGQSEEMLVLNVLMTGEGVRKIAQQLSPGHHVRVAGRLRKPGAGLKSAAGRAETEVIADSIELMEETE